MNFLTVNDFVGEVNLDLHDVNVQAKFDIIASQVEEDVLRDLMNDKLYSDLIADFGTSGTPETQKYIDLVDGITYAHSSGETRIYDGIKRMLKYFIYDFVIENPDLNTSVGQMFSKNENSTLLTRGELIKSRKRIQNKAVSLYNKAIVFIYEKRNDYFSNNDYAFWAPKPKKFIGCITTQTVSNNYFYNKSSEEN